MRGRVSPDTLRAQASPRLSLRWCTLESFAPKGDARTGVPLAGGEAAPKDARPDRDSQESPTPIAVNPWRRLTTSICTTCSRSVGRALATAGRRGRHDLRALRRRHRRGLRARVDARRFWDGMPGRLEEFALSLHPDKTRLIEFGRHVAARRAQRGLGNPGADPHQRTLPSWQVPPSEEVIYDSAKLRVSDVTVLSRSRQVVTEMCMIDDLTDTRAVMGRRLWRQGADREDGQQASCVDALGRAVKACPTPPVSGRR
jgi:hypothetical protein